MIYPLTWRIIRHTREFDMIASRSRVRRGLSHWVEYSGRNLNDSRNSSRMGKLPILFCYVNIAFKPILIGFFA